jgi:hypothetical protein
LRLSSSQQQQQQQQQGDNDDGGDRTRKKLSQLVKIIYEDTENVMKLEIYKRDAPCDQINAFGFSLGENIINCMIVPYIVHKYDSVESCRAIEKLEQDNKDLKSYVQDLAAVIEHSNIVPDETTKELLSTDKRARFLSDNTSSSPLLLENGGGGSATNTKPKRTRGSSKGGRGRPTKKYNGFTRVDCKSRHAKYRCDLCRISMDVRIIKKHTCPTIGTM